MKKCPYCAEQIQDEAVYCRFCSKNLNAPEVRQEVIFSGNPSLKGYPGLLFLSLLSAPLFGLGVVLLVCLWINLSSKHYRITNLLIETEEGVFVRKNNSLDNWRIKDIKLSSGPVQRLLNTGTLTIISIDKLTPVLNLRGLPNSKDIYQKMKQAAFNQRADRKVTGMEIS